MQIIDCIGQKPVQERYLENLCKEARVSVNFLTWNEKVNESQGPLLVVFDELLIDEMIGKIRSHRGKVLLALHSRREFKFVAKLRDHFDQIFGFVDLSQEADYNTPILLNYLNLASSFSGSAVEKLISGLDDILKHTEDELKKIEGLHKRLVKVRVDQFEDFNIYSKFRAGQKSGGEFFDMIQSGKEFLYLQTGSDNYLVSSLILSSIEELKEKKETMSLTELKEKIVEEIEKHAQENSANLNYAILHFDLIGLNLACSFRGEGYLYFQGKLISFEESLSLKLKPADKIYQLSSGFLKNIKEINSGVNLENLFEKFQESAVPETLNELIFEVSKNKQGAFLDYDAFVSGIEINHRTLYKI